LSTKAAVDSEDEYVLVSRTELQKMLKLLERAGRIISQSSAS